MYGLGPEQEQAGTRGWRKDCLACLEADLPQDFGYSNADEEDSYVSEEDAKGAELQAMVAETLAYALFVDKNMQFSKPVIVDVSMLPEGPPDMSKACFSCVRNWVLDHSMAVATGPESAGALPHVPS
jgi:hypothetical protein